jgi:NAD(P)-dependent dehydrogenase (short-subunit alcohol dehydrogenase family)
VLVNNAGVGIGAAAGDYQAKQVDLQLAVNIRAVVLFYRECAALLRTAGEEHRGAWVVNLASLAGKTGPPWLSVYGATKAAVISYTESMNKELGADGVRSVAFCPGFVDTDMADFMKEQIPGDQMIQPNDLAEALRMILRLSPGCAIPEIMFQRPGEAGLGV